MVEWERRLEGIVSESVALALPHVPEGDAVLIDIGANLGFFTKNVLVQRPRCRAYLFEPVRGIYERCAERFAGDDRVVVVNAALSDRNETCTIWKPTHNPGGNTLNREAVEMLGYCMQFDEETIECRVFDEWARENGVERVDFVKVDAECYDAKVLAGMLGFLGRCDPRPTLLVEIQPRWLQPSWAQHVEVFEQLHELGYPRVDAATFSHAQDVLLVPERADAGGRARRSGG
jgi:FkbM family methyltransferase